jgi:hypothetical protein
MRAGGRGRASGRVCVRAGGRGRGGAGEGAYWVAWGWLGRAKLGGGMAIRKVRRESACGRTEDVGRLQGGSGAGSLP